MNLAKLTASPLRYEIAGLTAALGGIVSIAMVLWGGPMSRYLPTGSGFHLAAIVGAGLAGLICASGFGRMGRRGWCIAAATACIATLMGAVLGAGLIGLFAGTIFGAPMGVVAIIDASASVVTVGIWTMTMAALHLAARRARTTGRHLSP
ncbi:MAG: hypothetical protein ACSHWS_16875 [Sulfitobacter sp.]